MKTKNNTLTKKILSIALCLAMLLSVAFTMTGCANDALDDKLATLSTAEQIAALQAQIATLSDEDDIAELKALIEALTADEPQHYAEEAYEKFLYIDKVLKERDCLSGEKFKLAQKWIIFQLMEAGYVEGTDIVKRTPQ